MKDGSVINFTVNGLHTSTVDRNGNTTTYACNVTTDLLETITDPVGKQTQFNHVNGLLNTVTDPAGRVTTFVHMPTTILFRLLIQTQRIVNFSMMIVIE